MAACTREPHLTPPPLPGVRWGRWERLRPGERDDERLWSAVGLGAAAVGAVYVRGGWPLPRCLFHLATGLPCPGCGATRAVLHLAHGEVAAALRLNPLATLATGLALLWSLYALVVVLGRLPHWRWGALAAPWPKRLRVALALAVLGNWLWLLVDGR